MADRSVSSDCRATSSSRLSCVSAARRTLAPAGASSGNARVKSAPPSAASETVIVPPCICGEVPRDGEAQPRSSELLGAAAVGLAEALEDRLPHLGAHAGAAVGDLDDDGRPRRSAAGSETRPLGAGVNLNALESRLRSTRSSFSCRSRPGAVSGALDLEVDRALARRCPRSASAISRIRWASVHRARSRASSCPPRAWRRRAGR